MGQKVPTLTTAGWIEDAGTKLITLFDYFLISEYSQSNFYYERISSLPYLVFKYGSQPRDLVEQTQTVLKQFLERYFDHVEVRIDTEGVETGGRYSLVFQVVAGDDEQPPRSLGRTIYIEGSRIIGYEGEGGIHLDYQ